MRKDRTPSINKFRNDIIWLFDIKCKNFYVDTRLSVRELKNTINMLTTAEMWELYRSKLIDSYAKYNGFVFETAEEANATINDLIEKIKKYHK